MDDGKTYHDVTEGHTPFPWIVREPPARSTSMPPIVQGPRIGRTAYGSEILAEGYGDDPGHERKRADCNLVAIASQSFYDLVNELRVFAQLVEDANASKLRNAKAALAERAASARALLESIDAQRFKP